MAYIYFLGYTLNDAKSCLQVGFNLGINIKGVYVSGGVSAGGCKGLLEEFGSKDPFTQLFFSFPFFSHSFVQLLENVLEFLSCLFVPPGWLAKKDFHI